MKELLEKIDKYLHDYKGKFNEVEVKLIKNGQCLKYKFFKIGKEVRKFFSKGV